MKKSQYNEMKSVDNQSYSSKVNSNQLKGMVRESDRDLQISQRENDYSSRAPILPGTPVLAG